MFKGVNVCVYVGEGLRRSFATPDPFVLTNKICLNQHETARDLTQQKLMHMIESGFPASKELYPEDVREYFRYREDLSVCDGLILFKTRVLIPQYLRRELLECLHSAALDFIPWTPWCTFSYFVRRVPAIYSDE